MSADAAVRGQPLVDGLVVVPDGVDRQQHVDEQEAEADHQRREHHVAGERREDEHEHRASGRRSAGRAAPTRCPEPLSSTDAHVVSPRRRARSGASARRRQPALVRRLCMRGGSDAAHGRVFLQSAMREKPFAAESPRTRTPTMPILLLLIVALACGPSDRAGLRPARAGQGGDCGSRRRRRVGGRVEPAAHLVASADRSGAWPPASRSARPSR